MLKGYDPTGTGGEDSLDTSIEKFVSESSFNNNVPVEESSLSIKHSTPVPSSPKHPIANSIGSGILFSAVQ